MLERIKAPAPLRLGKVEFPCICLGCGFPFRGGEDAIKYEDSVYVHDEVTCIARYEQDISKRVVPDLGYGY